VKFIFATTEVHKVPVTILSRCQRYDFKLIGTQVIVERLRHVLAAESIKADDAAVQTLAREAAGSMRDAMSLLDQVIAFSGSNVTADDVSRVLGVANRQILHDLSAALVDGNAARCVTVVDELAQQGFDLTHVAKDVLRHLRDLVVAKVCGEEGRRLLDLADEEARDVFALAARAEADDLSRLFQGFSRGFDDVTRSGQPRTALEMTLVRLARRPALIPLDDLLARLGDLEKRLGGGSPTPPRSGGTGPGARGSGASGGAKGSGAMAAPFTTAPVSVPSATQAWSPTARVEPTTRGALALAVPQADERRAPPAPAPSPAPPAPKPSNVVPLKPAAPQPSSGLDHAAFRAILVRVAEVRPALKAILEHATPLEVTAERVSLAYDAESFLGTQARDPEAVALLTQAARAHFGSDTAVSVEASLGGRSGHPATIATLDAAQRQAASDSARRAVEGHPLVTEVVRLFGAELREVRLPDGEE
jgi:DNA polymerase-3 subunit gamma/tau